MPLLQTAWSWAAGTANERGAMVRRHAFSGRCIPEANLIAMFNLTDTGLRRILAGDDWRPEYDADHAKPAEPKMNSIDARLARLRGSDGVEQEAVTK